MQEESRLNLFAFKEYKKQYVYLERSDEMSRITKEHQEAVTCLITSSKGKMYLFKYYQLWTFYLLWNLAQIFNVCKNVVMIQMSEGPYIK